MQGRCAAVPAAGAMGGVAMRRCANCEYENSDDAKVCARCGRALPQQVAAGEPRQQAPGWLSAVPAEGAPVAAPAAAGGSVAEAAALPVQVRRSRVPVLSVDARRVGGAATAVQERPAEPVAAAAVQDEATAGEAPAKRRAPVLPLVLLLIVLAIVVFLVAHFVL